VSSRIPCAVDKDAAQSTWTTDKSGENDMVFDLTKDAVFISARVSFL
jgi:hypothetical protein